MKLNYTSLQHAVRAGRGAARGGGGGRRFVQATRPGPAPPRAPRAVVLGGGEGQPGASSGLRAERRRRASGRAVARRDRAARARAAGRARHGRARLRGRARGDQHGRRARRRRPTARMGGDRLRPRAGNPRLGDGVRARRAGGARQRPRRARPGPADPALPTPLRGATRAPATAGSAITRPRCSSCCSARCGSRCPRSSSRDGRRAARASTRSTCRASSTRCTRHAATVTTWRSSRWTWTPTRPAGSRRGRWGGRSPRTRCSSPLRWPRGAGLAGAVRVKG